MHISSEKRPRPDAVARRRRMHRRHATRRLSKVFIASVSVFTLAVMLRPDMPMHTVTPVESDSTDAAPRSLRVRPTPNKLSTLASQPMWRPAGEVLKRGKATVATPLPLLGVDTRAHERRESLGRWHSIYTFATKYRIKTELARTIYDAATAAGIEPELGFRLVRVESVFDPRAVSPVGALGLTQLMLGTAREFEPNVTREQLLTPEVNLRIGFKYLRALIREYKGDLKLALLVYNRGPAAVGRAIAMGQSPANGYESIVTKGYRGRGTID